MAPTKLDEFTTELAKANRRAYHDHENLLPSHPVRVKDHPAWFSRVDELSNTGKIQEVIKSEPELKKVLSVLSKHGTPYMVGGSVRDIILGKKSKDFDIEVYGIPENKLNHILETELGAKPQQVGKQFGVFKFGDFDISLPRKEVKTGEKHTDFDVQFDENLSPEAGAKRRDFTLNALMYNAKTGEIEDYFGGLQDLENKLLKHIDDKTFVEDALRVYRAAQFAGRFGFTIHPATQKLAATMDLSHLPPERLYEEFKKLFLKSSKPSVGIHALDDMGVIDKYFPEVAALKTTEQRPDYHAEGNVYIHTNMVIDKAADIIKNFRSEQEQKTVMLAAFVHDFGKPATTKISDKGFPVQPGHEAAGVEPALAFLKKLTTETDTLDDVAFLVEHHLLPMHSHRNELKDAGFRKMINKYGMRRLKLLAAVSRADVTGRLHKNEDGTIVEPGADEIDWFEAKIKEISESLGTTAEGKITPLITGNDLIGVGFKEGPDLGKVLGAVRSQQEEGNVTNKAEAMKFVKENFVVKSSLEQFQDLLEKQDGSGGGTGSGEGGAAYAGGTVMGTEQSTTTFGGGKHKKKKNELFDILSEITRKSETPSELLDAMLGEKNFKLEMTPDRQKGLGGRQSLDEGTGMVFPFRAWWPAQMTMNDMQFPLDFIIVGEHDNIIEIKTDVQPADNVLLTFPPCKMIIEVNAGEAQGILLNDIVSGVSFFNNYMVKQLGEAPGASYARAHELVPKTGSWQHPGAWVRPEEADDEEGNPRTSEKHAENQVEGFKNFTEKILNSIDFDNEANIAEEELSQLEVKINSLQRRIERLDSSSETYYEEWEKLGKSRDSLRNNRRSLNFINNQTRYLGQYLERGDENQLSKYEFKFANDGTLASFAKVHDDLMGTFHIDTAVTVPSKYRKGTSSFGVQVMMDVIQRFLTESKADQVAVSPLDDHVQAFYEKAGFRQHEAELDEFSTEEEYNDLDGDFILSREDATMLYTRYAPYFKMAPLLQKEHGGAREEIRQLIELENKYGILAGKVTEDETLQKQEAPGAQEARQRGLVPQSGNWTKPIRWVRPEEMEGDDDKTRQDRELTSKIKFFEAIEKSYNYDVENKAVEVYMEGLPPHPGYSENETPEQKRINDVIREEHMSISYIEGALAELDEQLHNLATTNAVDLETYEFKMDSKGNLAAFATVNDDKGIFYLDSVVTMPSRYKKSNESGGTQLMMDLMHRFLTESKSNIVVVRPLTQRVRKFYEKFGFKNLTGYTHGSIEMTRDEAKESFNNFAKRFNMDLVKQELEETDHDSLLEQLMGLISLEEEVGVLAGKLKNREEEDIEKQMLAPDHRLSFETAYPAKTGHKGESDFVRELAEAGKLNEAVTTGKTLEERRMNLKEELDKIYQKQEQEMVNPSGCSICKSDCGCSTELRCECDHDCLCPNINAYRVDKA